MRQLICLITLIFLCFASQAQQYQKEHTFNQDVTFYPVAENEGYFSFAENKEVTLYNDDYSLYKKVSTPDFLDYEAQRISYLSKNLFNSDDNLEFLVSYRDTTGDKVNQKILMDENGSKIKQFGGYLAVVNEINGSNKLILRKLSGETTIYNVPGELNETNAPYPDGNSGSLNSQIYPNPASASTTIQYKLPRNQNGRINIYDATGSRVDHVSIGPDFNKVHLDVSSYQTGNYTYQVISQGAIEGRGKFVVQ